MLIAGKGHEDYQIVKGIKHHYSDQEVVPGVAALRLSYAEIAAHLGLPGSRDDRLLTTAVTDSREACPGALFVCVPGSRVDGHDFAAAAVERGAGAVLAQRPLPPVGAPVLLVPDTVTALGRIAALWRSRTRARVVGITGTAGKTTLKEVLAQVLAVRGQTARNALNHNNQIGMPRAMLATDGQEDFWVLEAGHQPRRRHGCSGLGAAS